MHYTSRRVCHSAVFRQHVRRIPPASLDVIGNISADPPSLDDMCNFHTSSLVSSVFSFLFFFFFSLSPLIFASETHNFWSSSSICFFFIINHCYFVTICFIFKEFIKNIYIFLISSSFNFCSHSFDSYFFYLVKFFKGIHFFSNFILQH